MTEGPYELNEVVMCKSRPEDAFGFPAKIQDVDDSTPGKWDYEIHFIGWKKSYDVWVEHDDVADMLFKHTPEIEAEHKRLHELSKSKKRKSDHGSMSRKWKVRRHGSHEGSGSRFCEETIIIPDKLKGLVIEDRDIVDQQHRQAKLPAHYTIDQIVKEYKEAAIANGEITVVSENPLVLNKLDMAQIGQGVLDYFNILIGYQLLYDNERQQYLKSCVTPPDGAPGKEVNRDEMPELQGLKITPSSVYGMGHLVRLFFKLRDLIAPGCYGDNASHRSIIRHTNNFLIFISKDAAKYHDVARDYEPARKTVNDTQNDESAPKNANQATA